ncbi:MAG: hypothetical protein ABIP97_02180 [Chthoniobacterales bacterium]
MANQRAKNKRNVTVTMEDDLRKAIEAYAKKHGLDRTAAVKLMCRSFLKIRTPKPVAKRVVKRVQKRVVKSKVKPKKR